MTIRRIFAGLLIVCGLFFAILVADALIGWRPRSGLDAHFQRVISEAQISDRYGNPGWDAEDATSRVCDLVDVAILKGLGMRDAPIWSYPFDNQESRPVYVLSVVQDKGLVAACRDHSQRYLRIEIDAETFVCTATVSVRPTCDP